MALNLSDINYSGKELATELIRQTFASSLLHTSGVRIIPSLKSKFVWHSVGIDLTINDGSPICPDFNTDFDLTQNNGFLCDYHVSGQINNDDLIGTYRELKYREGVLVERVSDDADLNSALMLMLFESISSKQDYKFLNDNAAYNCQNGLLKQFEDDEYTPTSPINNPVPSSQKLTSVAITAANVQQEISRVINAMPGKYKYGQLSAQFSRPKIYVSYNILDAYLTSLTYTAPQAAAGLGDPDAERYSYRSYELVPLDGLADDVMFMSPPDNICIVWDSERDLTNLVFANGLEDSTLCKVYKFRLDYRTAIFFGLGEAIVYYR